MKLAPNFWLSEFTKSQTAIRLGLENNPNEEQIENLTILANKVLQPVRDHFYSEYKLATTVTSGFRGAELNKAVGGNPMSQHCKGEAADIEVFGVSNLELAKWIADNLVFDQLILEFYDEAEGPNSGWVHVSYSGRNRNEVLTMYKSGTRVKRGLPIGNNYRLLPQEAGQDKATNIISAIKQLWAKTVAKPYNFGIRQLRSLTSQH